MQRSLVDLHIHSTASDGVLTPTEVVHLALKRGLSAIALTDHDTLAGVAEAQAAAGTRLEVIPGVEVNSEGDWGDLHFLGLYVDPENPFLNERLRAMQEARVGRAQRIVKKLAWLGMPLDWEEVRALAGGQSVGRPHIARALLNHGYISTTQEAFDRYIGREGPAYVPRLRLTPTEVIEAIHRAGGVAVLAHPAYSGVLNQVETFVSHGLEGLEVYYPDHSPEDTQALLALCQRHGLLATGGSDFHGPGYEEGAPVGSVYVPWECVQALRR
ncbi:MAG TPA: PHP domain-containing protein, partial [Anaerolineae bacterium]|nr:PHP domain-containing protein [Anaerolineae bacterium]